MGGNAYAQTAPTVSITVPTDGFSTNSRNNIVFQASATDVEDDNAALTAAISWTSSINGGLGTGGLINRNDLSVGVHTITASVTDSGMQSNSDSITVTINNVPPSVSITNPADGTNANFGTPILFQVSANDVEDGSLTGSVTWTSSIDGNIGSGASTNVNDLSVGTHTITAAVTDSNGANGSDSISVTINNSAPTVNITNPSNGAAFDSGANVNFQANATDEEDGSLTASIAWTSSIDGALGSGGSINVDTLSVGNHTINASVTDSDGSEGSASIAVSINNNPPQANDDGPFGVDEGGTLNGPSVLDNDSDPEDDPLTAAIAQGPANAANFTLNPNGTFVYVHDGSETTTDSFTYRAGDGSGQSDPATVTISITPVNDAPQIVGQDTLITDEDTSITIALTDLDIDDPDSAPGAITLTLQAGANYTVNGLTVVPQANFNGTLNIGATVSDGQAQSNPATIRVTVRSVNDDPVLTMPIDNQVAVEASLFSLDVSGNFDDIDGDNLSFDVDGLPPSGNITFNPNTGSISGTPRVEDARDNDPYIITVTASDGGGGIDAIGTFNLAVSALDRANISLTIGGTPDPAILSDQLRWTFTMQNSVGPQASGALNLSGAFVGNGLSVTTTSGCVIGARQGQVVPFDCSIGGLAVGTNNAVTIDTTGSGFGDVTVIATVDGINPVPIDPNADDNTAQLAIGVAQTFSNGAVQVLGTAGVRSAVAGDINGDGALDIVNGTVAGQPVQVWLSDGFRQFTAASTVADTGANEGVALADFNGDGNLDLVVANGAGQADRVYRGDGTGSFAPLATLTATDANSVAVGDFNNDGNADIAVAATGGNPVFHGNGSGGFNLQLTLGTADSRDVVAADFDGDGRDDVAFANVGGNSRVWDGARNITMAQLAIGDATSVAAGQFGGSDRPDLVFGRVAAGIGDVPANPVFVTTAGGNFGAPATLLGTSSTFDVHAGDVNSDGLTDIVIISSSGLHQIWNADGAGGFTLHGEQIIEDGAVAGVLAELGFSDVAQPGGVDLAMGGFPQPGLGVYLNDGVGNLGRGDAVAPTLALIGESTVDVPSGSAYVDEGATATDNIDGDISTSVVVDNPVNPAIVGAYTVTYTVMDFAGNEATPVTRTVNVTPASGTGGGGGGGAVSLWLLALGLGLLTLHHAAASPARARSRATRQKRISG
jgi:VCBS repeat-containing protein